jgi:hypothetical protein
VKETHRCGELPGCGISTGELPFLNAPRPKGGLDAATFGNSIFQSRKKMK